MTIEGIENEATHAAVLGLGCAYGQGWYFGKAMNGNQAVQLLGRPIDAESPKRAQGAVRRHVS